MGIITNQLTTGADNWGGEVIDYLLLIIGITPKAGHKINYELLWCS